MLDRGIDDDWIWITAMLYGGSGTHVPILVSNDQMRDHRLAIAEPLLFKKWIEAQVMRVEFEKRSNKDVAVFIRESIILLIIFCHNIYRHSFTRDSGDTTRK